MRLAEFITTNIEAILLSWESFGRTLEPGQNMSRRALRDHAPEILRAIAKDMRTAQSHQEGIDKSRGVGDENEEVNQASVSHGIERLDSGFDLPEVISEYRALRASVVRLWRKTRSVVTVEDLDDLSRFSESVDQSLSQAVSSYVDRTHRSQQMFLAVMGHDLRDPLQAIRTGALLLSRGNNLAPAETLLVSRMSASANAMNEIISDLLDFSRSELKAVMPICPESTDLASLCKEVVEEMRLAYPTRTMDLQCHGTLSGEWDASRLRQAFSNLLSNAVQHGTGPITFVARQAEPDVLVTVKNHGTAIPANAIATLFDPLVRAWGPKASEERRVGSLGLGLHIAREVVTTHGGTIAVESSEKDGTIFTVRLPRRVTGTRVD